MNCVFYGITMKTSNGKTLYLKCSDKEPKDPNKPIMEWTFNVADAYLDDNFYSIKKFAEGYFKDFNRYQINTITIDKRRLRNHDKGVAA